MGWGLKVVVLFGRGTCQAGGPYIFIFSCISQAIKLKLKALFFT